MTLFRPRNLLLLLALILAGLLAAVVVLRFRPALEVAEIVKTLPQGVDVALQEIRYSHTEGGVERWRLAAGRVEHRGTEKMTAVRDLEFVYFDDRGGEQGKLKARHGQVNADFSVIEIRDQVEIVSRGGFTLHTDHLTFHQRDRSIRTDAAVRLVADSLELDGIGMHLDLGTQRLQILDKVHAIIRTKPQKRSKS